MPALSRLEVANSLPVAVQRGRIDAEFRRAADKIIALPWQAFVADCAVAQFGLCGR